MQILKRENQLLMAAHQNLHAICFIHTFAQAMEQTGDLGCPSVLASLLLFFAVLVGAVVLATEATSASKTAPAGGAHVVVFFQQGD